MFIKIYAVNPYQSSFLESTWNSEIFAEAPSSLLKSYLSVLM